MKKSIIGGLLMIVVICSAATYLPKIKAKTKWSKELKYKKTYVNHGVIAKDAEYFYTVHTEGAKPAGRFNFLHSLTRIKTVNRSSGFNASMGYGLSWSVNFAQTNKRTLGGASKFIIKKFNKSLEEELSREFNVGTKKDKKIEFITHTDNTLWLFTSEKIKKEKTKKLYVESIDLSNLERNNDPVLVTQIQANYNHELNRNFKIITSEDSSKVLVLFVQPDRENKLVEKFRLCVLDENMNRLWKKEVEFPSLEDFYRTVKMDINNEGNVCFLGKRYMNEKTKDLYKNNINIEYVSTLISNNGENRNEATFLLPENKHIDQLVFALGSDNQARCTGFFVNPDKKALKKNKFNYNGTSDGAFSMILDVNSGDVSNIHFHNFKKNYRNLNYIKINQYLPQKNGDAFVIAEQFNIIKTESQQANMNSGSGFSYGMAGNSTVIENSTYNNKTIIVYKIKASGEISWSQSIQKNQYTSNDGGYFNSYATFVQEDKIHFFYNDHVKNISLSDNKGKVAKWKGKKRKTVVMMATINNDGKLKRKPLLNPKQAEVLIRPYSCNQLSKQEMLLYGEDGIKKYKFASITVE